MQFYTDEMKIIIEPHENCKTKTSHYATYVQLNLFLLTSSSGVTRASTLTRTSSIRFGSPVTAFNSGPKML